MAEYIEREAFMKYPIRIDHYDKENGNEHFVLGIESVLEFAEHLPAADVEKVRHGRWEFKHPNGWACSKCGEWGLMIDNRGICKSNYCPNCGAKMDAEG